MAPYNNRTMTQTNHPHPRKYTNDQNQPRENRAVDIIRDNRTVNIMQSTATADARPANNTPITAQWSSRACLTGGGVAIFQVRAKKVVVCYHPKHRYWFLPKGRRDAGEEAWAAAQREGFEESGYRNRLLPLPVKHWQPASHQTAVPKYVVEPVWTEMMPLGHLQYLIFWYIAETLPPALENELNSAGKTEYDAAPAFPSALTLSERIGAEPEDYVPPRHLNTGVDADELTYESHLIDVDEARKLLGWGGVQSDVVRIGWEGICKRLDTEEQDRLATHAVTPASPNTTANGVQPA